MFDPFLGLGQPPFPFRGQPFVAPRRPGNFKILSARVILIRAAVQPMPGTFMGPV